MQQYQTIAFPGRPTDLAVRDFTGDGFPDFITAIPARREIHLYQSTGMIENPFQTVTLPVSIEPEFLAGGDVNGDGFTDICALSYLDERLVILLGGARNPFTRTIEIPVPYYDLSKNLTYGRNQPLTCADTGSDSVDEIYLLQEESDGRPAIYQYEIQSASPNPPVVATKKVVLQGGAPPEIQAMEFNDINRDGMPELLVFTISHPSLLVYSRVAGLEYQETSRISFEDTIFGNTVSGFTLSDANGDGIPDIVVVPFDGTIRMITYQSHRLTPVTIGNLGEYAKHEDVLIADIDRDGLPDLLVASYPKSGDTRFEQISVVCGEKPGEFKEEVTFFTTRPSTFFPLRLGAIDFNRDGLKDIFLLDIAPREAILFLNQSENATSIPDWRQW